MQQTQHGNSPVLRNKSRMRVLSEASSTATLSPPERRCHATRPMHRLPPAKAHAHASRAWWEQAEKRKQRPRVPKLRTPATHTPIAEVEIRQGATECPVRGSILERMRRVLSAPSHNALGGGRSIGFPSSRRRPCPLGPQHPPYGVLRTPYSVDKTTCGVRPRGWDALPCAVSTCLVPKLGSYFVVDS